MAFVDIAKTAWGEAAPDWILTLAAQCDMTNQRRAAERIGYSAGLVSSVLRASYKGNMQSVEQAVRGAWMGSLVTCPVMGSIASDACLEWRRKARKFAPSNPHRVRMHRACNVCHRNQKEGDA